MSSLLRSSLMPVKGLTSSWRKARYSLATVFLFKEPLGRPIPDYNK